jgi:4-hydroxy-tetrahydrodipicolinate synthase
MYQHFKAIAEAVDIPVILYNVPGRTVADMSNDTIVRLAQIPGIVGVRMQPAISRGIDLIRRVPEGFAVYSGDDATAMALMLVGGKGNISVTANVAPKAMHELCVASMKGDIATARAINDKVFNLHTNLFIEPNPVPVKWALAEMEWSLTACVCHWSICLRNIMMW